MVVDLRGLAHPRVISLIGDGREGAAGTWLGGLALGTLCGGRSRRRTSLRIGVPKEGVPGERRVAVTPAQVEALRARGHSLAIESQAGVQAGFVDDAYVSQGASLTPTPTQVLKADVILCVDVRSVDASHLRSGQTVIGLADPLRRDLSAFASSGATLFALELLPRITRAQSMDVLSAMATLAGYKAVLIAAARLPRMFPMMVTAAGTYPSAKALVLGAGVAGLQAIATAKRLGATVTAYDVRAEAKQQVESVGARFASLEIESEGAQDERGYARELGEDFYAKQRELMSGLVKGVDIVITTALIPGKPAPRLLSTRMVEGLNSGAVIVDLAAGSGGNCELTRPDETVHHRGVTIVGPTNLPASVPYHASQMYGRNIMAFFENIVRDGVVHVDREDPISRETLVAVGGRIVHSRVGSPT